jgi:hypothetical protein
VAIQGRANRALAPGLFREELAMTRINILKINDASYYCTASKNRTSFA